MTWAVAAHRLSTFPAKSRSIASHARPEMVVGLNVADIPEPPDEPFPALTEGEPIWLGGASRHRKSSSQAATHSRSQAKSSGERMKSENPFP